jgi:hypothetical protein
MGGRLLKFFALLIFLSLPVTAGAQDAAPGPADASAIRGVIAAQLNAFQHDDGNAAYSYASPTIQTLFHDADTFMEMVRTGYQPVYRAHDVEFRDLGPIEGRLVQQVYMVGPDGVAVIADYAMQKQPDGSWKIDGCSIQKAPDQGV